MCYRLPCQLYCVIIKLMENLHTEIGKNGFLNIQVTEGEKYGYTYSRKVVPPSIL